MDYIPIELYGKPFRFYNPARIEHEAHNRKGNWKPIAIYSHGNYNGKVYKRMDFSVNKKIHKLYLHRVVYFAHNQEWDIYDTNIEIDHIHHETGKELDNSISNLRAVTHQQNMTNMNRTGYSFRTDTNKWSAYITVNKIRHHLGCYDTKEEAHKAYTDAKPFLIKN